MAFMFNHYYELRNKATGKYVNLYGNHASGSVSNGETVNLYARSGDPDQHWALEKYDSTGNVRIVLERGGGWFAMNYHTGNGSCIIWHLNEAADSDTAVTMMSVDGGSTYYLKLRDRALYLTASGSSLKWLAYAGSSAQQFVLEDPQSGGNTGGGTTGDAECEMPVNLNQKYPGYSEGIRNTGCALCCGVDLASFKKGKNYTIEDFAGHYSEGVDGNGGAYVYYSWTAPDGVTFSAPISLASLNERQTIEEIRSYVSRGIPVACHAMKGTNEHWFVAYAAAANGGSTWSTCGIKVLAPFNKEDITAYEGRKVSILKAMQNSNVDAGIDRIRILT